METRYTIIVGGRLDPRWSGEFGSLRVRPRSDGTTVLDGAIRDQSDLHGQIRRIESLGLKLISVQRDGTESLPPVPGTTGEPVRTNEAVPTGWGRRMNRLVLVTLLGPFLCTGLRAQESNHQATVLDRYVALALDANLDVAEQQLATEQAAAQLSVLSRQRLPAVPHSSTPAPKGEAGASRFPPAT